MFCGEEGRGSNPNIGQTQKLVQNIETLILVNLAKNVGFGQRWFGQTWFWPKMVWPNLVLATDGVAKVGKTLRR